MISVRADCQDPELSFQLRLISVIESICSTVVPGVALLSSQEANSQCCETGRTFPSRAFPTRGLL